jgi:hypothetical protein
MAIFFQEQPEPGELADPFLSKACCQHGVSSVRRVRLKATGTGHGCVNDQNEEAMHRTAGRTGPPTMQG